MADFGMVGKDDIILLVFLFSVVVLCVVASHGIASLFRAFPVDGYIIAEKAADNSIAKLGLYGDNIGDNMAVFVLNMVTTSVIIF